VRSLLSHQTHGDLPQRFLEAGQIGSYLGLPFLYQASYALLEDVALRFDVLVPACYGVADASEGLFYSARSRLLVSWVGIDCELDPVIPMRLRVFVRGGGPERLRGEAEHDGVLWVGFYGNDYCNRRTPGFVGRTSDELLLARRVLLDARQCVLAVVVVSKFVNIMPQDVIVWH